MTNVPVSVALEAILLFRGGVMDIKELANALDLTPEDIEAHLTELGVSLTGRGSALIREGPRVLLGTAPEAQEAIDALRTADLEGPLGKAGLETLAIVLYLGPVSRSDIEYIRGVQSSSTVRTLLMRGLIERNESGGKTRYRITPDALAYLGARSLSDIPEFAKTQDSLRALMPQESAS
ncbi:SMC-Scp complex subunit ScpB [Patescibacteria group bacterium]|nr:SMC-Scp complex subunit ScpB [Patescibacteria group bacterium]